MVLKYFSANIMCVPYAFSHSGLEDDVIGYLFGILSCQETCEQWFEKYEYFRLFLSLTEQSD